MARTSNSVKNILSGVGLKIILLVLRFVTRTIFIKYLGNEYLSVNGLVSSILSFLNLTDLGIGTAIVFAMYKPIAQDNKEKVQQYLGYYRKIYHILGLVILTIGLVIMPFLRYMVDISELTVNIYVVYILYLINAVSSFYVYSYRGGFLTACQEDYRLTAINYIGNFCVVFMQIISLVLFHSFYLYIATPILVTIVQRTTNGIFIAKWYPYIKQKPKGKLSREEKISIYKNTYGLAISKISVIVNNAIDNIVISMLIGLQYVGLYSNYQTLLVLVSGFVDILFVSVKPSVGNLNVNSSKEYKERIFNVIHFMSFWLYGLCSICFLVLVQPFVVVWIGKEYLMPMVFVFVVCLNFLTNGMTYAVSIYRESCGLYYHGRYRPIFTAMFNVLFSVVMGYFWGATGIVLATIISRMITVWWYDAYIVYKYVFDKAVYRYLVDYLSKVLVVIIVGILTYFVCNQFKFSAYVNLILSGVTSFVVVNALFMLLYRKTDEYVYMQNLFVTYAKRIYNKFVKKESKNQNNTK